MIWLTLVACNPPPTAAELDQTRGGRVEVFFNDPGTRPENMWDADVVDVMVSMIDHTQATLDVAVMGFSHAPVYEAVVRAWDRGVAVRFVGDASHWTNDGYTALQERHVPMQVGNMAHIMHDKFMISDGRMVFCGTANWSETDLLMNANNFVVLDGPEIAEDFREEFDQMFAGRFGSDKVELENGRSYTLGDTEVEVWFSPNEDAMGRILELVDAAEESVRFTIFAFTKDQVGSAFVRKHTEILEAGTGEGVFGVIDQSQLHSNGQYHEVYRLISAGIDVRLDGNDNTDQPGDYQAGGGRLHSKTMLIDANGAEPIVITGSFNWSASATASNDEYLLVMRGERVRDAYLEYFEKLWFAGRRLGGDRVGDDVDGHTLAPGDLVINEVMWYGVNHQDLEGNDEFLEIRNLTDRLIDLDLWVVANPDDVVVGFPPGSWVGPGDTFTVLDHVLEPYVDGAPQDDLSAYWGGDLIVNPYNDNRQSRLYLKDGVLELRLLDPGGTQVDVAGDGGPAFAGGPEGKGAVIRSMERVDPPGDGSNPESWFSSQAPEGGTYVNEAFKQEIRATPDEPNSR